MDECLNDDDDEEHHRVFFDCFDAQRERLCVHAGSVRLKRGYALPPEPSCRTAWLEAARDPRIPAPTGTYGRSAGR